MGSTRIADFAGVERGELGVAIGNRRIQVRAALLHSIGREETGREFSLHHCPVAALLGGFIGQARAGASPQRKMLHAIRQVGRLGAVGDQLLVR